jgi:hypothetical protein
LSARLPDRRSFVSISDTNERLKPGAPDRDKYPPAASYGSLRFPL